MILERIQKLNDYLDMVAALRNGDATDPFNLMRALRLPVVAAIWQDLQRPILYITDRQEKAAAALDEIEFWQPGIRTFQFYRTHSAFLRRSGVGE